MPWVYINECAAHLLRALDYEDVSNEFADSLGHSENGFVAQFYQLRNVGLPVPGSIREFVANLSPQAVRIRRDTRDAVRRVMTEIQFLLMGYGIGFDPVPRVADQFQRDVQMAYVFKLRELKRRKSAILVDHDVTTLSYMRQAISRNAEKRMYLTWDAAMIAVAGELKDCGWVVSPHEASDIIQQQLSLSVGRLTALAHGLARVQEWPTELGARIIDRVVELARDRLQDWQFRDRLKAFQKEALSRIEIANERYADTIDRETDRFLEKEGGRVGKAYTVRRDRCIRRCLTKNASSLKIYRVRPPIGVGLASAKPVATPIACSNGIVNAHHATYNVYGSDIILERRPQHETDQCGVG
jgi:hypothetical protein